MNQKKYAEFTAARSREVRILWLCVLAVILTTCALVPASAATGRSIAHNTPSYVSTAKNLGAADPSSTMEVTIWLNLHNRGQLDTLAGQLYDPTSSKYRHWLTRKDFSARFAPTAAEAKTVQKFFQAHNMKIVTVGPDNFFVRASGTLGDVEKAFRVHLNNYQVLGNVIRANDRDPYVAGAAAALVDNVSGLDTGKYEHPMMTRPVPSGKGTGAKAAPITTGDIFSPTCFNGLEKESFSTQNNGSLPIGTYAGNHLNLVSQTSSGCGYTPPMIQAAYNLTGLYNEGYTGTGQTIGIIDWCGSFTIQSDANAFSAQYGLPLLTSSNFAITNTAPSFCEAYDQVEINIDVEWAHAIAPGANINLIVPPSATFQDVNEAEYIAVNRGLVNVLSGSYGSVESFTPASVLANENLINEIAAVLGISANFSSGDNGDFSNFGIPATVSAPADSPWATAVGGVTLALNPDNSIAWQAGWGNNQTLLAETGSVFDPPITFSFVGGAGGGPSNCASQDASGNCLAGFPKPSYQKKLAGKVRQLPDISWLADPYTGAAILISIPGNVPSQVWQVWGGTSVACPMFAGLWAIANQEALAGGGPPLGLAAPYMYSLPAGTFYDIVPVGSKTNVTASLQEPTVTNNYSAGAVLGDVPPTKFVSALWDYPFFQYTALTISFGTDCMAVSGFGTPCNATTALHTKVGWDNVTGVGTPNAKAFADSFFGK
jgi:subtilase family serine protease